MEAKTIEVLKSFASINQGIVIEAGNQLRTVSQAQNVYAEATIDELFERDFAIYNLPELLSVISMFGKPEFDYSENFMTISEGDSKVRYVYSNAAMIISPQKGKTIPIEDPQLTFHISKEQLNNLLKAAAILKSTDLVVSKKGVVVKSDRGSDNCYSLKVNVEGDSDKSFNVAIDSLRLIPADYEVTVTPVAIFFVSETEKLKYVMTLKETD